MNNNDIAKNTIHNLLAIPSKTLRLYPLLCNCVEIGESEKPDEEMNEASLYAR